MVIDLKLCYLHVRAQTSSEVTIKRASTPGMRYTLMITFGGYHAYLKGFLGIISLAVFMSLFYKNANFFLFGTGFQRLMSKYQVAILAMEDMLAWMDEGGQVWHFIINQGLLPPRIRSQFKYDLGTSHFHFSVTYYATFCEVENLDNGGKVFLG